MCDYKCVFWFLCSSREWGLNTNKQTNTTATHLYWEFPLGAYIGNHLNNGSSETYNGLKSAESQGTKKRGQKISGPFFQVHIKLNCTCSGKTKQNIHMKSTLSSKHIHINSKCWTKLSKCVYYLHNKTEMLLLYNYSRFNTYYTSVWSQKLVITDLWNLKEVLHYFININWMNEWFNYWNTKGLSKTLKIIINVKQS